MSLPRYTKLPTDVPASATPAPSLSMPTYTRRVESDKYRNFSWVNALQRYVCSRRFLGLAAALFLLSQLAWLTLPKLNSNAFATSSSSATPPHSGWLAFDAKFDSPYLVRLTHSAPTTQQELLFTEACRDLWISRNRLCPSLQAGWFSKGLLGRSQKFDVVHTWQDGSDPLQANAREEALAQSATQGESGNAIRHFRIHDELRHSLRSVFKAFGRHARVIKNFYFLSTDLPTSESDRRLGMVPKWLDVRHPFHQHAQIHPLFPWKVHKTSAFDNSREAEQWRDDALPVFNSMAVESQFTNVPTSTDIWLMSCDDMFLLNDMTPSDV